MIDKNNSRLDRIEQKIDTVADAVVAIARAEEKIISLGETTNGILDRLVDYDSRMRAVEGRSSDSENQLKSFSTFIWTIVTAISTSFVGGIVWLLKHDPSK
jgi:hypothetical protein